MFMKIRIVIPMLFCIAMTIGSVTSVFAAPASIRAVDYTSAVKQELLKLDETADHLYEAAYTNNRQAGFKYAQQLKRQMKRDELHRFGQTAGWRLLEESVQSVETTLRSGKPTTDWLIASARIHLTTDALLRPQHALWLQYEKVMLEDLRRVNQAWNRQTGDGAVAARAAMHSFTDHLSKIEAAAAMQRPSERITELKERMKYTNVLLEAGMKEQTKQDWTGDSIHDLQSALANLFADRLAANDEPVFAPPAAANPITWSLLLGAIITGALTYTAWKKYRHVPYGVKKL
ncbi:sporulation protein YpjB [Paenibacillus sp. NPDC058174]|uniref:sporulation protein YpjB n=1 Tax=Paenibacillus sp. NPDC058174 TaxID=3346366 RepID=UPI0036DD267D